MDDLDEDDFIDVPLADLDDEGAVSAPVEPEPRLVRQGYECGAVRTKQGHPPKGWWKIHESGEDARWFCSKTCAVRWLVADERCELTPWAASRALAALAGRPWHDLRDMTERRLGLLLSRAYNGLIEEVRLQTKRDQASERLDMEDLATVFSPGSVSAEG